MNQFNIESLKELYRDYREKHGKNAYKYISDLFIQAKELHRQAFIIEKKGKKDHEQSWRAFKGKNLEKLIHFLIETEIESLGLKIINGNKLERTKNKNLSVTLEKVKRNLLIDYKKFGYHLPDVDLVIFCPKTCEIIAVLSSKVTLRERIAQTAYWKLRLTKNKLTKHIKVYFITLDEDGTLTTKKPAKKGRAIVENDLDGTYVLTENAIEQSRKVKLFEHFIHDLKELK